MPHLPRYPVPGGRLGSLCLVLLAAFWVSGPFTGCAGGPDDAGARDEETLVQWIDRGDELVAREDRESCRRAVTLYSRAAELARELDEPLWEAGAWHRLGRVHRKYLEERREAIGHYGRALVLYEAHGEIEAQGTVRINLGRLHFDLGEMDDALAHWQRARSLVRRSGDRHGEAGVLNNLALAARYLGEPQKALGLYDQSLEVLEDLDRPEERGRASFNRGRLYETLGQSSQALADYERALALGRELEEPRLLAMVLTAVGRVRASQGDPHGAVDALEEALGLRQAAEQERGHAVTLLTLGSVYEGLGRLERAAEVQTRALAIFRGHQARRQIAQALTALAGLDVAAGRPGPAVDGLREALPLFRELRDPAGEVGARFVLARAERARGRPLEALEHVDRALEGLETLRRRAATHDLRRSFAAAHRDPYDFQVDLLMELHHQEPGAGFDGRALVAAERSRARSLLELLTGTGDPPAAGVDPALVQRERDLEDRLELLDRERLELVDRGGSPERLTPLESRLDAVLRDLRAVRGRIVAQNPRYASFTRPPRFTLEDLQAHAVDAETLLLEYHLGDERSHLWAVTPDSVTSFELPPRSEIEAAARRAHELLRRSHHRQHRLSAEAALARLGRMVLDPAADVLQGRRLLVAADGALHYVPFAALPRPRSSPPSPLIAAHEVVHVPSASTLLVLRDEDRRTGRPPATGLVAVVADPVFGRDDPRLEPSETRGAGDTGARVLSRLRHSRAEAEAIRRLAGAEDTFVALGFEATREAAVDVALGRYRIAHLATHGVIDAERPELSQLVFSRLDVRGRPREGSLWAHELYELDLAADLVVLSACGTALGREVRGEGLVGLTQGFFSAGASRVLVSLWQVDDRATARLMERFYARLLAGESPSAALREAQLSLRGDTGWQAPYHWAPFVLQGEWR